MKFNVFIKAAGFFFFVLAVITLLTGLQDFDMTNEGFNLLTKTLKEAGISALIGLGCFVFEAKVLN